MGKRGGRGCVGVDLANGGKRGEIERAIEFRKKGGIILGKNNNQRFLWLRQQGFRPSDIPLRRFFRLTLFFLAGDPCKKSPLENPPPVGGQHYASLVYPSRRQGVKYRGFSFWRKKVRYPPPPRQPPPRPFFLLIHGGREEEGDEIPVTKGRDVASQTRGENFPTTMLDLAKMSARNPPCLEA